MTGAPSSAGASMGQAFVIGTDAPAANVVSFTATLESVDAIDSNNNSVPLISGSPTVDFARYDGLQTLLDVDDVPAGTYSSISITLGPSVTVGYLDTTVMPPSVKTTTLSVSTAPIDVALPHPLTLTKTASGGVRLDFDLNKSIQITDGQISGVNPAFNVGTVYPDDAGGHIDEFVAGVLGVDATNEQFTIQGPHGRQFTVNVNGQTNWDDNSNLGELTTNTIVQISGKLDKAESTIDADEIAVLSQDKFFASGQITYVAPPAGEASSFDLYLRSLEPTNTGLTLGNTATVELNGAEKYYIYWMRNPMTEFLFNSSALVAGQDVSIGGPASGAADPTNVTIKRVVLRQWGFEGTIVPGSLNAAQGTFKMQVTGFAGVLIPTPITVFIGNATDFRYGFTSASDMAASTRIRVVGLLLKNAANGNVVLLARHVDDRD
ncbi:MAG TPA: DUF4382 domain-containing protein [Acidobacteriaceae bacterium]|nr:DUF4382 domain-containing protein [Acidobacteriaceae bacterium]